LGASKPISNYSSGGSTDCVPLLARLMGLVPHSLCSVFAAFMQNGPDVARTLSFSAALKTGDRPRQHNSMPQFRDRQTRERIAMMEDH
jgi:hypothetical protein